MSLSAVELLIGKVVFVLENEVLLIGGVGDEIVQLKQELESMRSFLQDADQKKAQTEGERNWVSNVREITFQVEDIIDEFVYHVNKQKYTGGKFMRSLYQIFYFPKNMWVRRRIATSLRKINNRVKDIPERSQRYGVDHDHAGKSRSHVDIHHRRQLPNLGESSLFFKDDDLVGIEDEKQQLLGWLTSEERQRVVISVVGMGGSGKTTLVARAYDSETVKQHFDCYAWITVSKAYQVDDLLRSMIKEFHKARKEAVPVNLSTMSYRELVEMTVSYLQSKRYVIVFDDVWSSNLWRDIYVSLPDDRLGSRVMLTTRMEDIASSSFGVKSYVHYVKPLGVRDAWELFCMKTFSGNRKRCCPPELKSLAQDLVAKCGGLPLAIVALGGVMSSKYLESEWRKVYNSLSWELDNNLGLEAVKTILLLSFNDLPYQIKPCFLYCCLFPEDYPIKRNRLIRIWIAEGFMEKVRGITPEEVAESYLMQLVSRSMLLVVERNEEGSVKECKMHDLMRELALKISEIENFGAIYDDYRESGGSEDSRILRRLSVHTIGRDVIQSRQRMSHLRSLLVFAVNDTISPSLKSLSRNLRLLRVLDLEDIPVENLPDELVDLFNLRYLNLCRTKVSELPKSIGRLCNLETLNISESNVQVLPAGITKLQNLRNLIMVMVNIGNPSGFEFTSGVRGPDNIWKLRNLQVLSCIEARGANMMKQLKSMTQLKKLGITKVRAADEEDLWLSIQNMSLLRSLFVMAADEEECLRIDALFSASALPHLNKLYLCGKLEKSPHWFPSLESLTRLVLHWSRLTEDPLPHIQALPNLGFLILSNACQGRTLLCFSSGFYKLRELWLINLPDLNEIVIERGVMPGLKHLRIRWCMQLKKLPGGIMHLTDLHELGLENASDELIHSIRAQGSGKDGPPMLPQHITRINHWRTSSDGVEQYENLLSTSTGESLIESPLPFPYLLENMLLRT